ncbi:glycosyltransferase [Actinophytocola xinjiangensis]|uniref:glycosyltransferase n=1 Tax=Actinophytocola xinjiangensis TaxID=485602 RepID=UPI000A02DAE9|nr:glycosyltransferase [Actinophytocola xinjiangensis]
MTSQQDLTEQHAVTEVPVEDASRLGEDPRLSGPAADLVPLLAGARVWHVSSTATGGGVAELLWSSIAHQRALGLPAGWLVADAEPEFFHLTKRIHHGLHGRATTPFTAADDRLYRAVTARTATALAEHVRAGDVVLLHDPQTAGMAPHLLDAGVRVAWRCHVGTRSATEWAEATWEFLRPHLVAVPRFVFTVADFAPPYLDSSRVAVMTPSIDPDTAKNRELTPRQCDELLASVGLLGSGAGTIQDRPLPPEVPLVTQVSRWDPLKDMVGVLRAFADHVPPPAHLLLAGPDPADVLDDPEGAAMFAQVRAAREALAPPLRERVHLTVLSLADMAANGLVVNAIQRRSTVVVQKSLQEGFGLTVTEAMWKARPIVASAVGGLLAQIADREQGLLVDPLDLPAFGAAVNELLNDPSLAASLGSAARRACAEKFLVTRELLDYLDLYRTLI